ncbi:MAG TPA: DNA modification methylase, partial [Cyanobacteria bacterium UBA11166]|nr:DNA modification methylase [Cyanobacteria bacterium UBA11166]
TSLFVASGLGMEADGIELLPIGQNIITTRNLLESGLTENDISRLKYWSTAQPWQEVENREARYPVSKLPELRITEGAYPEETKAAIEQYISRWREESHRIQTILHFALLCIVESVSYTRKDGQYLRWDYRANRSQTSKPFDKGEILSFDRAISAKLNEIIADLQPQHEQLELFAVEKMRGKINLHPASCLDIIPGLPDSCYDAVITSPPYCNRYDYTRTYALELALLGIDDQKLSKLRQEMLSCTVENRPKDLLKINPQWETTITIAQQQELLQAILQYLEEQNKQGILNNKNIPRMVRGYFYEMACVIAECKRVMKANAPLIIVNDNVRYAGVSISVDLILSDMAEKLGFCVENILVLPDGKGNSSQQMGEHGREPLRKCIYVWRKI